MAVLEVKDLQKSFGGTPVLEQVSFSLEEGETLVLIGSSGSGKTTLLRCLGQLEQPDSGSITVAGEPVSGVPGGKRLPVGMVFQSFHLFPQYTALENVTLSPWLEAKRQGKGDAAQREAIRQEGLHLLEQMGLADRAGHYPHQLSGGQQQRVAIARALALHPRLLCFDEPTSALDPELTGEVLRVIRQLAQARTTMVIVTHEMAFAREVADRVIFMEGGRILEQGTPQQVLDAPTQARTRQFLAGYRDGWRGEDTPAAQ